MKQTCFLEEHEGHEVNPSTHSLLTGHQAHPLFSWHVFELVMEVQLRQGVALVLSVHICDDKHQLQPLFDLQMPAEVMTKRINECDFDFW